MASAVTPTPLLAAAASASSSASSASSSWRVKDDRWRVEDESWRGVVEDDISLSNAPVAAHHTFTGSMSPLAGALLAVTT
jgi:hypothetical protein